MASWLRRSYYLQGQWGYRHVERRLLVEPRISPAGPLTEYCFRCHGGVVASATVFVDQHQSTDRSADFAGDGSRLPPRLHKLPEQMLPPGYVHPPSFFQAREIASRISRNLDHVRVDFLVDGAAIYLGELTIYPGSGYGNERWSHTDGLIERNWFRAMHLSWFYRTPQPWPLSLYQAAFRRFVDAHVRELDDAAPADEQTYVAPIMAGVA